MNLFIEKILMLCSVKYRSSYSCHGSKARSNAKSHQPRRATILHREKKTPPTYSSISKPPLTKAIARTRFAPLYTNCSRNHLYSVSDNLTHYYPCSFGVLGGTRSSFCPHLIIMSETNPLALSNREEDELLKATKAEALQKCDDLVRGV